MEPLKSLLPFGKWLLRVTVALQVYSIFFDRLLEFELTSVHWFVAFLTIVFTVLLIIGGVIKKSNLTVVSGMLIFILSVIMMFMGEPDLGSVTTHITPAAIGFFFMAGGNKT